MRGLGRSHGARSRSRMTPGHPARSPQVIERAWLWPKGSMPPCRGEGMIGNETRLPRLRRGIRGAATSVRYLTPGS